MASVSRVSLLRLPSRITVLLSSRTAANVASVSTPDASTKTHTGAVYNNHLDARFVDRRKEVNPRHAIDLIAATPVRKVHARSVYCNGGGGALGHPKVYINLDPPGPQDCTYCGLRFEQDHSGHGGHSHGGH
eukprot:m.40832 g.40832  ORF g.40832 m.40832 type:complete len:132 (+) comp11937_c0_seq1:60-455(+)